MERKNAWKSCDEAKLAQVNALCADYIKFISDCKTERECVEESIRLAEAAGYKNLNDCIEAGTPLKAGNKVYANNMGKTIALFVVGTESMCAPRICIPFSIGSVPTTNKAIVLPMLLA